MPVATVITNHPGFYYILNVMISSDTSLLWQCLGLPAQSSNLPPHVFKTTTMLQNSVPYSYVPIFWYMILIFHSLTSSGKSKSIMRGRKEHITQDNGPPICKFSHISYTTIGQHLLVCLIHVDS